MFFDNITHAGTSGTEALQNYYEAMGKRQYLEHKMEAWAEEAVNE